MTTSADPADCAHHDIETYTSPNLTIVMWACTSCHLRFYPACRACVSIGHRNGHVPLLDVIDAARVITSRKDPTIGELAKPIDDLRYTIDRLDASP